MSGLAAGEAEDLLVAGGNEAGNGLAGEGDGDLTGPFFGEMGSCEGFEGMFLKGARTAEGDALGGDLLIEISGIREVVEAHEHIDHFLMKSRNGGEVKPGLGKIDARPERMCAYFQRMKNLGILLAAAALLTQPALGAKQDKKKKGNVDEGGTPWYEEMVIGPAWMNTFGDYYEGEKRVGAVKGLSVDLGEGWRALYDTEGLRLVSIYKGEIEWGGTPWTGKHGVLMRFADQDALVATASGAGWAGADGSLEDKRELKGYGNFDFGAFKGHYKNGRDIVIEYSVNGTDVMEHLSRDGGTVTRSFKFGKRSRELTMVVADGKDAFEIGEGGMAKGGDGTSIVAMDGITLKNEGGRLLAKVPAGEEELVSRIAFSNEGEAKVAEKPDFAKLTGGGPRLWDEILTTEGKVSEEGDVPYVTDLVTLPEDNPWNSKLRFGGFDFLDKDTAVLSTWNGDVWTVKGLASDWSELKWQRIATGLFEPLGVKVADGEIYVNGRDQITRLIDLNDDGETDHFEVFNRDVLISENFHEFAFDLQTDKEGNFYFSKASPVKPGGRGFDKILPHHGIVAKIGKDGSGFEVLATGLRAPGGIGIGPEGQITTGENEGSWMPCCKINYIKTGQTPAFMGAEPSRHLLKDEPYLEPLVYLPMDVDNSGGSQVWVPEDVDFGLKGGEMLHLSYGKSAIFRVLPSERNGKMQGGVVKLPISLQSSAMRARFHESGNLYVAGFRGWQTNAATPSAFQRVRYNPEVGLKIPEKLEITDKGVNLTFPEELDEELALDPTSYSAQRWNYVRGPQYGSGEFSVDSPDEEAIEKAFEAESKNVKNRDSVEIESVTLSEDKRTVSLVLEGMKPAMSLKVAYDLEDTEGEVLNSEVHATVYGE